MRRYHVTEFYIWCDVHGDMHGPDEFDPWGDGTVCTPAEHRGVAILTDDPNEFSLQS